MPQWPERFWRIVEKQERLREARDVLEAMIPEDCVTVEQAIAWLQAEWDRLEGEVTTIKANVPANHE